MAGWVLQLLGRGCLFLLELEKRFEIGVALQIPENALENGVTIDRLAMALVQAEKELLLGVIELSSPVRTIIIDQLLRIDYSRR
jgi:hypothetical protein